MKRKKLIMGLAMGLAVVVVLGGLFLFRDKIAFKADILSYCTLMYGNELDRTGLSGCSATSTPATPTKWIKDRIAGQAISKVTRIVVDCSKSKMDVFGWSSVFGEVQIAGNLSVNTGARVLSAKDYVTYKLASQRYSYKFYVNKVLACQSSSSGTSVMTCEDQIFYQRANANAWVVIQGADPYSFVAQQVAGITAGTEDPVNGIVRKCLPPNIKDSNATPLGTYTIDPRLNRSNPRGLTTYNPPYVGLGKQALRYEDDRGLLIHGSPAANNSSAPRPISRTLGCIRMYDDQLAAIFDIIKDPSRPTVTIVP